MQKPEIVFPGRYDRTDHAIVLHSRQGLTEEAAFACKLMLELGKSAFDADDEDSAGRQKARRLSADELVAYCCEVSETAFAAFEARDWLFDIPSAEEVSERNREADKRN